MLKASTVMSTGKFPKNLQEIEYQSRTQSEDPDLTLGTRLIEYLLILNQAGVISINL